MRKNVRVVAFFSAVLLVFAGFSGCTSQKTVDIVLSDMVLKMAEVKQVTFDTSFFWNGVEKDFSSGPGVAYDVTGNLKVSGVVDLDSDPVRQATTVDFTSTGGSEAFSIALDMVQIDDTSYMKLHDNASIKGLDLSGFADTWYLFDPVMFVGDELGVEEDSLTVADIREIRNIARDTSFFTLVTDHGTEQVNGEKAYHYTVQVNQAEVVSFATTVEELVNGEPVSDDDKADLSALLSQIANDPFDIWVGTNDNFLYKATGTFNNDADEDDKKLKDVTFEVNFTDFNKPVSIETPAGAKEFDITEAFSFPGVEEMKDFPGLADFDEDKFKAQMNDLEMRMNDFEKEYNY